MEMGDIYGLLRYLGLSAEGTRFFHVSYAVLSDDTAASPDAVCRMVAVPGSCRTLSHLHFQREAQRLRCGGPGMGNGKRSAEIHHEVICVACRNGDVSAKLCMKSLEEVFPCFMKIFG